MRRAVAVGMRQINLLLIPAAAFLMVLATPVVRLIYQRGQFGVFDTHLTSIALFWFAVSLPFGGINLLLTRTFFALKRPWIPTGLAAINIVVDIIVSVGLYRPLGIAGLVIGTAAANIVMTGLQLRRLRQGFNGRLEGRQTLMMTARITLASALLAGVSWVVWYGVDQLLGRSILAQIVSVGAAAVVGGYIYMRAVLRMRIPEAHQVRHLVMRQLGRA
jgi:putative peptidoglycan lipid II flippase